MSGLRERNPFVGPRPIRQGEPLHGRSVEVRGLYDRLQARRIVVLHSPSGAGKSSLVHAGLIPRLEKGGFDVWRPIRVNLDPRGLSDIPKGTNRYMLSALVSLEEELPEARRRSPAELATLDLLEYLQTRPRRKKRAKRPVALLFDQFEEVLTADPHAVEAKRQFFSAVGRALDDEHYWALFIIREDYLAALAPYRDRVPTQLSNTFRLDLLGLDGAREAAVALCEGGGRAFPTVDKLVRDLSTIQVQQPDGSFAAEQGRYVEPVHLQVVGKRLWDSMPDDDPSIDAEDIKTYARVSEALAGYYADTVAQVSDGDASKERAIREWVSTQLIVGSTRSQVRQEKDKSAGLPNELIRGLVNAFIVRTEQRAGALWFELSHDRMVEPVEKNNAQWEENHLHALQVRAKLWQAHGRDRDQLLGAGDLEKAELWAKNNPERLTDDEIEFLRRSRGKRTSTVRIIAVLCLLAGSVISATAISMYLYNDADTEAYRAKLHSARAEAKAERAKASATIADEAKHLAEDQRETARRNSRFAYVQTFKSIDPTRAVAGLLEFEKFEQGEQAEQFNDSWLQNALDLSQQPLTRTEVWGELAAWSPDGTRFVTTRKQNAAIWNADGTGAPIVLRGHEGKVLSADFNHDGTLVVTASVDRTSRVFRADDGGEVFVFTGHHDKVKSARFSRARPEDTTVVTASVDGTVQLWRPDGTGRPLVFAPKDKDDKRAMFAEFSPDDTRILTVWGSRTLRIWNIDETADVYLEVPGQQAAFSSDGTKIVTTGDDARGVWDLRTKAPTGQTFDKEAAYSTRDEWLYGITEHCMSFQKPGDSSAARCHDGTKIRRVAMDPEENLAVTGAVDGSLMIWRLNDTLDSIELNGDETYISEVGFSPKTTRVATSDTVSTRVWDVPEPFGGQPAVDARYSPNGKHLVVRTEQESQIWTPDGSARVLSLTGEIDFGGPGGDWVLASARQDSAMRLELWDLNKPDAPVDQQELTLDHHPTVDLSENGQHVLILTDDSANLWARTTSSALTELARGGTLKTALFSPTGDRFVTTGSGPALVWQTNDVTQTRPLSHEGDVLSAHFSPDGRHLVTVAAKEAWVWDLDRETEPVPFSRDFGPLKVKDARFSPNRDDPRVLVLTESDEAWLWVPGDSSDDAGARTKLTDRRDAPILSAAFSPDGRRIIATGKGKIAWIWMIDSPTSPLRLHHASTVHSASVSSDGGHAVTLWGTRPADPDAPYDLQARLWTLDPTKLRRQLDASTTVCISVEDRKYYLGDTEAEACHDFQQCEHRHGRPGDCDAPSLGSPR